MLAVDASSAPSFRSDKNYPNLGLRLRVLGNSVPEPLAPCKTYTYTFTRGDESTRADLYDPQELWYATQHAGQWRDGAGNLLILAKPTRLPPEVVSPVPSGHVGRDTFDRALADDATRLDPDNAEALGKWFTAFTGCAIQAPQPLRLPFNLSDAFYFPTEDAPVLAYAFRLRIRQNTGPATPSEWYCAIVRIGDGTLKSKVRKDFEAQFLTTVAALPRNGLTAGSGVQSKALSTSPANGRMNTAAPAISDDPSRVAARRSVANMKDWWYAETPEYIFLSNIRSATGKGLIQELQATLPALRSAYVSLIPSFEAVTDVSVIRILDDEAAYRQYVGKEMEWSIGVWSPARRELEILSQGKDRERTLRIIRHEGFHQYLFYATRMLEHAVWFNEGHACFFECAEVDSKGRVALPESPRVNHLLPNLEAITAKLPALLRAGRSAFYGGSDEQRALSYTGAWALVYFLRKGVPSEKLTAYSGILDTYLKTLKETGDSTAATDAAFANLDMAAFQEAFADFWKRGRNSAKRYDPLADKTSSP